MKWVVLVVAVLFILAMLIGVLGLFCEPPQHTPMSYDEEMRWLMEDHGLTWEEANEIASLSSWRH